jgi:hypothetical protein
MIEQDQKLQTELQETIFVWNKYSAIILDHEIKLVGKKGHINVLEVS